MSAALHPFGRRVIRAEQSVRALAFNLLAAWEVERLVEGGIRDGRPDAWWRELLLRSLRTTP